MQQAAGLTPGAKPDWCSVCRVVRQSGCNTAIPKLWRGALPIVGKSGVKFNVISCVAVVEFSAFVSFNCEARVRGHAS